MLLSRVGKKSKLTAHQTKTSELTLSCSSVTIFVQEIKEKLTLESLNKRQTRRARPSSPWSTPLSLLPSSNGRPISVTCQGSDCKFWTTFRSRAHGLQDQPLQAFVNRNFAARSRIRNLLHQTLSLLTDRNRRTDCWIRRKQNMIRNNPDKSEFSNLLHCVLCTRLLILKHTFRRRRWACERAGVRFIVNVFTNQKK